MSTIKDSTTKSEINSADDNRNNQHEVSVSHSSGGSAVIEEVEEDEEVQVEQERDSQDQKNADDNCNLFSSVRFCELFKIIAQSESEENFLSNKFNRIDLTALPAKQYLEETVIPILMQALQYLVRERPPEPINALCVYLLKYKSKFELYCNTEPPESDDEKAQQL